MNLVVLTRAEKGWTQAELAQRSGVSRKAISRVEAGALPSVLVAGKLAAVLGLDVADILDPGREAA